ncbi:tyrosine-protein phosphatase [Pseudalkalibacillus caeni]|uniref:Tyrosine-protein phosphatase n=1 Tax=Exobacillus caeni TaxID=2574798 RepID=A0A5R9F3X9_9BACL|nr:CpsB/CapC family capsule biosynthesis tyrosine phosphatase [Pseudalkalibacillus caeni]TLS35174.1 tyrosine protein phosphatase [Pseudalkalibacillus caeni]
MIDIHCHILSGVDDGARNEINSIEMARKAVEEGITKIVATPHHKNGHHHNERSRILEAIEKLNQQLKVENIPLTILPGQEIRINGEMEEEYESHQLLTFNDQHNHMLVEFPSSNVPSYSKKLFFDLQLRGITPVIAHPERNKELMENPDRLYDLVKNGALTQLTASSLTGDFGKKIKKFSIQLIEHGLTHFLASDAHNCTNRSFHLQEAYNIVENQLSSEVKFQFQENAERLVHGETIFKEIPDRIKKKKFFFI